MNSNNNLINSTGDESKKGGCGWHFMVLMSRQGKIRLSEFFSSFSESDKRRILRDIAADVLPRAPKMCNIIEKGSYKFVYRRYASLYFVAGVPLEMNELLVLEQIHLFVEALDGYFNSGMSFAADTIWRFLNFLYTLDWNHSRLIHQCVNLTWSSLCTNPFLFCLKCLLGAWSVNPARGKC